MSDTELEAHSYELVPTTDGHPSQEDAEWQDSLASIDEEVARPEPIALDDPAVDALTRIVRSYAKLDDTEARLDEYYQRAKAFIASRRAALEFRKRQEAYNLATHLLAGQGGKKRSYDTPYGRVGFRRKAQRLKLLDAQAIIDAADAGQVPARCIKITTSVVKAEVDKLYKNGGEIPPGCVIEPEQDEFYIR